MSTILQNSYNYSQPVSDILAGNNLYLEDIENLMYSIAGSCYVNSYNADASMCALGLIGPGVNNQGHAVVLESYDASTNTYHYTDPQNGYATGTISASDLEWVISGN